MAEADGIFETVINAPAEINPSITVHEESGLQAKVTYKFRVSAENFVGEGPMSNEIFVIAADMPEKPPNPPRVTLVTQSSISLELDPLAAGSNGGSDITGYIVEADDGLGGDYR
jgi:hypothetical protein